MNRQIPDPEMNSDMFKKIRLFRGGGGGGEGSRTPPDPDRSRVKRVLFGPPDHEANRRFAEEELAKGQREMSERYNFDFLNDRQLDGIEKSLFKWCYSRGT